MVASLDRPALSFTVTVETYGIVVEVGVKLTLAFVCEPVAGLLQLYV
jgi:hypothetical protein